MTTEQTWTREQHEIARGELAAGLSLSVVGQRMMLAEIERTWGEIERLSRAPDPDRVQAVTEALLQHGANKVDAPHFARVAVEAMGGPATEDERTQAERWAVTHFGDRDMWALLDERQRARMTTAMLPLVREARRGQASRPAPLPWDERAAVLRFLDREIARCAANPDPANAAIMAARASALRVAAGRIRAGDHAVGADVAPAPLTEYGPPEDEALRWAEEVIDAAGPPEEASLDMSGAARAISPLLREAQKAREKGAPLTEAEAEFAAAARSLASLEWGKSTYYTGPIVLDLESGGAKALFRLRAAHLALSASRGDIPADVRAQPSEPTLTEDERDLVIAAIPLQMGVTRDGQQVIGARDDVSEAWAAFRPFLARIGSGEWTGTVLGQIQSMWRDGLARGQIIEAEDERARRVEAATRMAEWDKALREPPTASVEPGSGYLACPKGEAK